MKQKLILLSLTSSSFLNLRLQTAFSLEYLSLVSFSFICVVLQCCKQCFTARWPLLRLLVMLYSSKEDYFVFQQAVKFPQGLVLSFFWSRYTLILSLPFRRSPGSKSLTPSSRSFHSGWAGTLSPQQFTTLESSVQLCCASRRLALYTYNLQVSQGSVGSSYTEF